MNVRTKAAVASVFAGVAVISALGAGVAQAANPERPTANYQLCGNVLNSGGGGVGGVAVTGAVGTWSGGATTAADGGYCLQGTAAMESAVLGGGKVTLTGTKGSSVANFGTWGSPGIDVWDFLAHMDSVYNKSAYGFNGTI